VGVVGAAALVAVIAAGALFCPARTIAAPAPPPLRINLDRFDHSKRIVALSNGMMIAYVELGAPQGKPVVLIHGYTDSARDWVPLVPYLAPDLRLILVDIRGHGRSSKPECCYTRLDFAYDIKLLLDHLGVRQADIIGHSLGSIIAQTFAEYWPERTDRVVLIASSGGPNIGEAPKPRKFDFPAAIRSLKEPIDPDSTFMKEWWYSPNPVDPDLLHRERIDSAKIPLRVWLAVLDELTYSFDLPGELQSTLPKLVAPTLLIWGSADPIIEEERRQTLREALPKAQVKLFDGLGHNPFWEDPQAVAATINAFLHPETPHGP
jgi:pimeloyl-ACP methyl ester carboxylesterase